MSGRAATINVIPGKYALSVGRADMPAPKGWQWVALGDIARLESGHTPSREHPEYWDGRIAWIGIKDARTHHGSVIAETFQTITQAGIENSAARLLPAETVCLSRTASVGYVVVMGREMATSQDFVNWVCGPAIDPHFLKQLLIAENESLFRFGKGSTHTTIYYPEVKAFHVCLPPLNEQKRIVAMVEALTARSRRAKETLDAVPPLLDQLRQSILAAAFRGDLTAAWRAKNPNVEPADKLLARIRAERRNRWETAELAKMTAKGKRPTDDRWKDKYEEPPVMERTDLDALPLGWTWVPLDLIRSGDAPMVYGIILPGDDVQDGVPYVRPIDIAPDGTIDVSSLKRTTTSIAQDYSRASLKAGDIIMSIVGTIGKVAVASDALDGGNITQSSIRIRPGIGTSTEYLKWLLQAPCLVRQYNQFRFGNAVQRLNVEHVRQLYVPLPPVEEQNQISHQVRACLARVGAVDPVALRTRLADLESSVLSKAFRGELVRQDPNDEPVSLLLERLRAARDAEGPTASGAPRRARRLERVTAARGDDHGDREVPPGRPESAGVASKDISEIDPAFLQDEVSAALWTLGPLEKDEGVRRVADHLREAGHVDFQRLRADGPLFCQILDAIELAVKAGRLDRPKRGHVRACKADAASYTADDWRHALVASLGTEPTDRDEAIRAAAEWARDNLGLEFARLRGDGHIVEGLRSAINSVIRRGDVIRHDATHISRAGGVQPALLLKGRSA